MIGRNTLHLGGHYLDLYIVWRIGSEHMVSCKSYDFNFLVLITCCFFCVFFHLSYTLLLFLHVCLLLISLFISRLASAPCRTCVQQMSAQSVPPGDENSWRRNRLKMELKSKHNNYHIILVTCHYWTCFHLFLKMCFSSSDRPTRGN